MQWFTHALVLNTLHRFIRICILVLCNTSWQEFDVRKISVREIYAQPPFDIVIGIRAVCVH